VEGSGASMVLGSQPSLAQPRQPMTRLRTPLVTFMPFRCPGRRGGPGLLCPASRFVLGCQRLPPPPRLVTEVPGQNRREGYADYRIGMCYIGFTDGLAVVPM